MKCRIFSLNIQKHSQFVAALVVGATISTGAASVVTITSAALVVSASVSAGTTLVSTTTVGAYGTRQVIKNDTSFCNIVLGQGVTMLRRHGMIF